MRGFCIAAVLLCSAARGWSGETVGLIKIEGAIGPATADYISRAIRITSERRFECLVIQLDTPGGLLDSTKTIVQSFFGASVPVVVYVAPGAASATSAGVFITLAADVAAMAPSTTIGAAHPVAIGGSQDAKPDEVMKQKLENFAVSFIESIATRRERNVEWAKSAVKESESITAARALELNVIDLIAMDLAELLEKIDGRDVNGHKLRTASAEVSEIAMTLREKAFQMLWRPEVMFILMLVAIYGIIGELSNPGAIIPGVIGLIALVLTLYMAAIIPINIAGVALILLAVGLFIAEAFTPTFGILTGAGAVAFFFGALMLFDAETPTFRLSLPWIISTTVITALFFLAVITAGLRAQFQPVKVGRETLIGKSTRAVTAIDLRGGKVFVEGELWNAVSERPVPQGDEVEITAIEGLTLKVKPKS